MRRLDETGMDYSILYPTFGLLNMHLDDQELRLASRFEIVDHLQEGELSLWRERRLGLVENVDAAVESVQEEKTLVKTGAQYLESLRDGRSAPPAEPDQLCR